MEMQNIPSNRNNFVEKKKKKPKGHVPWFQIILQEYSNQKSTLLEKKDTWVNRTESPEINIQIYGLLVYNKGTKNIWWSDNNSLRKLFRYMQKNRRHYFTPFAKITSKWIKELNVRFETFNLFQHQGLFQWVCSLHQVAKILELQL